jgi:hypothetical protein
MSALARKSFDEVLPLGAALSRMATTLAHAATLTDECQHHVSDLLALAQDRPDAAADLQRLDLLSQMLHGLVRMLQRAADAAPEDATLDVAGLIEGIGLGDLVMRIGAGEAGVVLGHAADSGDFEAF